MARKLPWRGVLMFVAVLGVAAYAGDAAVRRGAPALSGAVRWVAWGLAATTVLLLVHGVPLALGILSKPSVLVATALAAAAGATLAAGARVRGRGAEPEVKQGAWPLVSLGAAMVIVAVGAALGYIRADAADPIFSSDTLNYQIPQVVRWIQTGSMWQLDQFFPDYSNATYPHHGNLLVLAAVLPVGDDTLARLVPAPFAGLASLAVFATARELGAGRGWALLGAALPLAIPAQVFVALTGAQTDTPLFFFFAAGGLFLLRHHRTGERTDLVLAGLGLGLAVGTKWYALTTVPVVLAVWAFARWRLGERWLADGARIVGLIAAAGGVWLVRNVVETGNPLFPQPLGPLPSPVDVIREQAGFTLAHYLFEPSVWRTYLEPQFTDYLAAPGYLLAAVALVAAVVAWRRRDGRAVAVAVVALGCLATYFVAPYSAFGAEGTPVLAFASMRYAVPGLLAAAVALAWLGTHAGRPVAVILAAVAAVAVLLGLREAYAVELGVIAASTAGLAVAVLIARRISPRAAVAAGLVVVGLTTLHIRDHALDRNYAPYDPVFAWIEANAPRDTTIALAGLWPLDGLPPVLPAFGPQLDNEVYFAGPFVDDILRAETDPRVFGERLGRADALIVGRGLEGGGTPAPEEEWARAAGFELVAASDGLALLVRQ